MVVPGMRSETDKGVPYIDPRKSKGFEEVDYLVQSFTSSFPRDLKDAIHGGVVDVHLLIATLAPNVSVLFACFIDSH